VLLAEAVQPTAEQIMRALDVPGLVIAAQRGDEAPQYVVLGTDAAGVPLAEDTLFPVASVTKLATALAILRLVDRGAVGVEDSLGGHLPEAAAGRDPTVTIRALLCHAAGLRYEVALQEAPYRRGLDRPGMARALLAAPCSELPWTRVNYSNVGYGLLGIVVERVTAWPFQDALTDLVLEPLGIEGYLGREPPRAPARITGDLGEHAGTDLEPYNSPFWRSLGSPGGGLVTTAADALRLVRAFAGDPAAFLNPATLAGATRDQTGGLPGGIMAGVMEWPVCPWGLGPELRGDKTPHMAPAEASAGSFGHGGASGAFVWCDPVAGVSWAMLGPRTFLSWWPSRGAIGAAVLAWGAAAG
jgi:CubicO group peptidase (beta-lactamase class C family)